MEESGLNSQPQPTCLSPAGWVTPVARSNAELASPLISMNHKRGKPKSARSGCLMCKAYKLNSNKTAQRMKGKRDWKRYEGNA